MILKYEQLWPNHPFRFRIPFQCLGPSNYSGRVEYRQSPREIKPTVLGLLNELDDDEFVYWCIDDKYPIKLRVAAIESLHRWLVNEAPPSVSGILFCRCRQMLKRGYLETVGDLKSRFLDRRGYQQIWIHQFLRVKVLRHLFNALPSEIPVARMMDEWVHRLEKPLSHRLLVTRENFAVFGESTCHGVITRNCYRSLQSNGLPLPDWFSRSTEFDILMGEL